MEKLMELRTEYNNLMLQIIEKRDFKASGYYPFYTPAYKELQNTIWDMLADAQDLLKQYYSIKYPNHSDLSYADTASNLANQFYLFN